jgi:hypothetical protein
VRIMEDGHDGDRRVRKDAWGRSVVRSRRSGVAASCAVWSAEVVATAEVGRYKRGDTWIRCWRESRLCVNGWCAGATASFASSTCRLSSPGFWFETGKAGVEAVVGRLRRRGSPSRMMTIC